MQENRDKINKLKKYTISGIFVNTNNKMDSELIECTQISNIGLTQDMNEKKSVIQYAWVILFHFDINDDKPFCIERLRDFGNTNFPWRGIKGEMTREFRIKLCEFSSIPGKQFFIFAKIQYGNEKDIINYYSPSLIFYSFATIFITL